MEDGAPRRLEAGRRTSAGQPVPLLWSLSLAAPSCTGVGISYAEIKTAQALQLSSNWADHQPLGTQRLPEGYMGTIECRGSMSSFSISKVLLSTVFAGEHSHGRNYLTSHFTNALFSIHKRWAYLFFTPVITTVLMWGVSIIYCCIKITPNLTHSHTVMIYGFCGQESRNGLASSSAQGLIMHARCLLGFGSHLRLKWGRVPFQAHESLERIRFLEGCRTEASAPGWLSAAGSPEFPVTWEFPSPRRGLLYQSQPGRESGELAREKEVTS